ncbi:MAG: hypothetical protein JWM04_1863 [Verrucomicrobiales bacterium]|nr:hypothetical protein [Verrucomicrobiales bacterium]
MLFMAYSLRNFRGKISLDHIDMNSSCFLSLWHSKIINAVEVLISLASICFKSILVHGDEFMTFPVIQRELRLAGKSPKTYLIRFVIAAIGAVIFSLNAYSNDSSSSSGAEFYAVIQHMLFGYCAIEGVRAASDCLSEEERNGTLGLLFLTPLKGFDVVLGKLFSAALNSFYVFLGLVPLCSVALLMGGVTIAQFLVTNLILFCFLLLCLSCGVFASSRSLRDINAGIASVVVIFVVCSIPQILDYILPLDLLSFRGFAPLSVLQDNINAYESTPLKDTIGGLVFMVGISTFLLLASGFRIQKFRSTLGPRARARLTKKTLVARVIVTKVVRGECLEQDPLKYLILRHRKMGWIAAGIGGFGLLVGILPAFFGTRYSYSESTPMTVFSMVIFLVLLSSRTIQFFNSLRDSGTLELLLTTSLSPMKIIKGCESGLRRIFLFPILMIILGAIISTMAFQYSQGVQPSASFFDSPYSQLLVTCAIFVVYYCSCKSLSMLFGLTERKIATAFLKLGSAVFAAPVVLYLMPSMFDLYGSNLLILNIVLSLACQCVLWIWSSIKVRTKLTNWAETNQQPRSPFGWLFQKRSFRLVKSIEA